MSFTMLDPVAIRAKCHRFRALILGRANAGKTTVLKKVCNSTEDPEIHSPNGTKIELETVEGSASVLRGIHDIENQLIFKSHPGYIFHDSRGFESGSKEEADKVIEFIDSRGRGKRLAEQLHVIWYCMPTETTRPLLAAEEDFFFKSDVCGKVVVIFTKWDGLLTEALTAVIDESGDDDPSDEAVVQRADEMLEKNFMKKLGKADPGPAAYVRLKGDMREPMTDCNELIEETVNALSDDALQMLLVSVQQNNLDLSIKYAILDAMSQTQIEGINNQSFPTMWVLMIQQISYRMHWDISRMSG
ncbi:hypothetical protein B0H16DRAFT_1733488 [Mycena metata]|uniref:G domain-containing protein n=1 Tax=Mycena metata TaxID=1033252 RepID=A0AAD7HYJ8_9AGAR|nr:hypothetical protein B0H16DRAFT_1733488 [Mycena metata]